MRFRFRFAMKSRQWSELAQSGRGNAFAARAELSISEETLVSEEEEFEVSSLRGGVTSPVTSLSLRFLRLYRACLSAPLLRNSIAAAISTTSPMDSPLSAINRRAAALKVIPAPPSENCMAGRGFANC